MLRHSALFEWLSRCARMVIAFGEWLFAYGKMKVNFRRAEIIHLIKIKAAESFDRTFSKVRGVKGQRPCRAPRSAKWLPPLPPRPRRARFSIEISCFLRVPAGNLVPVQRFCRYPIILHRQIGTHSLPRLAAARSRRGSDSPPGCHSIPLSRIRYL